MGKYEVLNWQYSCENQNGSKINSLVLHISFLYLLVSKIY